MPLAITDHQKQTFSDRPLSVRLLPAHRDYLDSVAQQVTAELTARGVSISDLPLSRRPSRGGVIRALLERATLNDADVGMLVDHFAGGAIE